MQHGKNGVQTERERQRKVEVAESVIRKQSYSLQSPLLTEGKYKLLQKYIPDARCSSKLCICYRGQLLPMKMKNGKMTRYAAHLQDWSLEVTISCSTSL